GVEGPFADGFALLSRARGRVCKDAIHRDRDFLATPGCPDCRIEVAHYSTRGIPSCGERGRFSLEASQPGFRCTRAFCLRRRRGFIRKFPGELLRSGRHCRAICKECGGLRVLLLGRGDGRAFSRGGTIAEIQSRPLVSHVCDLYFIVGHSFHAYTRPLCDV